MRLSRLATALAITTALTTPVLASNSSHDSRITDLKITALGTYQSGLFEQGAAEIVAHDVRSQRLFVVNAASGKIDVLDIRQPTQPVLLFNIDLSAYGSSVNSVAVHRGLVAAAVQNTVKTEPGKVVLLNADGQVQGAVDVGALPDMLTFTPDGRRLLVAN